MALKTVVIVYRQISLFFFAVLLLSIGGLSVVAQSTSQDFPTAITANEISGTIRARDLGDSRLTTYYYALNGDQGDLFINLVTRNFTGDIDVFTVSGLKPMTKIVVYADYGDVETGRAIYLRKPEKMILRIQGRTPNDDAATFRLKFAGSFLAAKVDESAAEPDPPRVSTENRGSVRVNSVGTILPPPPPPPVVEAREEKKVDPETVAKTEEKTETKPVEAEKSEPSIETKPKTGLEVVVTDPTASVETPVAKKTETTARRRTATRRQSSKKQVEKSTEEPAAEMPKTEPEKAAEEKPPSFKTLTNSRRKRAAKKPPVEPKPDPLASINLVIQLKDGNAIEKKMSEVFKFSVDKGILTVILKDGTINKYTITDVAKVTIE